MKGAAAAAALAALAGLGLQGTAASAGGATSSPAEARAAGDRTPAPNLPAAPQRLAPWNAGALLQRLGGGVRPPSLGGYRKHPRGSHKQKRRIAMRGRR